jgi:hypothetical protein
MKLNWRSAGKFAALTLGLVAAAGAAFVGYRGGADATHTVRATPARAPVPVSVALASRRNVPIYLCSPKVSM